MAIHTTRVLNVFITIVAQISVIDESTQSVGSILE